MTVPTILITGPSGVGKTTVASETGWILSEELDASHALIEMDHMSILHPMPDGASMVPAREAAYAIASMFLGIELLSRLDPSRSEADSVLSMMETMAGLADQLGPALFTLMQPGTGGSP